MPALRPLKSNDPDSPRQWQSWEDAWNPYHARNTRVNAIDDATFQQLIAIHDPAAYIDPDLFLGGGCLDAPDEIPLGGTECVSTVGGFCREGVLRLHRETESWAAHRKAQGQVALMIKGILDDIKAKEEAL